MFQHSKINRNCVAYFIQAALTHPDKSSWSYRQGGGWEKWKDGWRWALHEAELLTQLLEGRRIKSIHQHLQKHEHNAVCYTGICWGFLFPLVKLGEKENHTYLSKVYCKFVFDLRGQLQGWTNHRPGTQDKQISCPGCLFFLFFFHSCSPWWTKSSIAGGGVFPKQNISFGMLKMNTPSRQ